MLVILGRGVFDPALDACEFRGVRLAAAGEDAQRGEHDLFGRQGGPQGFALVDRFADPAVPAVEHREGELLLGGLALPGHLLVDRLGGLLVSQLIEQGYRERGLGRVGLDEVLDPLERPIGLPDLAIILGGEDGGSGGCPSRSG